MLPSQENTAFFEILPNLPDDLGIGATGRPTSDLRNGSLITPTAGPVSLTLGTSISLPLPPALFGRTSRHGGVDVRESLDHASLA